MTNLLHRSDEFVTVHNKYSEILLATTTHFATRVGRSGVVRLT
jgi:hypothetical protein